VLLRSIAENNPAASLLLSDAFKHMRSVLALDACTGLYPFYHVSSHKPTHTTRLRTLRGNMALTTQESG
jgi:hypothetical protein